MEEKTRSSTQNAMYYGLITGAALVVYSLILYITEQYMNRALGYISFVMLVGGMVWVHWNIEKRTQMDSFPMVKLSPPAL